MLGCIDTEVHAMKPDFVVCFEIIFRSYVRDISKNKTLSQSYNNVCFNESNYVFALINFYIYIYVTYVDMLVYSLK